MMQAARTGHRYPPLNLSHFALHPLSAAALVSPCSLPQPMTLLRWQVFGKPPLGGIAMDGRWQGAIDALDAVAGLGGGVEACLGHESAILHWFGAVGARLRDEQEIALEFHAVHARPVDGGGVPGIDVGVDDRDALDQANGGEGREHGAARLARPR